MRRLASRFERAIARVLVISLVGMTPASAIGSDDFPSADGAEMLTPGTIVSDPGQTTITSFVEDGATNWTQGLDLPAGHTLAFDLLSDDSTHWNHVGGDFSAHIDGTITSGPNNTIVFASPFGVFIGSEAILDVGTLVAVGADVLNHDLASDGPVLELTGDVENQGLIRANADVLFYGRNVRNSGEILAPNGEVLLLGAETIQFFSADAITQSLIHPPDFVALLAAGSVLNHGRIVSSDASLLGGRVANYGEIEIADGSLMMIGADAVYVSQFNNPVLVRIPHSAGRASSNPDAHEYRVENHGQIHAGLGHVRLAASDPLGWGIRQGTGSLGVSGETAEISAQRIEIEGGEDSRVRLSGNIDAMGRAAGEIGGEIDITGSVIALVDATIDASGDAGGGTIQIGGEQQGQGELQRAQALVMDAASEVRADALHDGDGGRVILFSGDSTLIAGELSARGGEAGGNGGFIETSGLRQFQISETPDASAPQGDGGDWLIDPYAINIVADTIGPDCGAGADCLNSAIEAILAPDFDSAAFDDVLRSVAASGSVTAPNDLSVDLLIRALAVGTNITLSTEAFDILRGNPDEGDGTPGGNGDITVNAPIEIRNDGTLQGTRARLTLLAAGSIYVNQDITVRDATDVTTSDLSLDLEFRANDQSQRAPNLGFGTDQLRGDVNLNASIRTGGGDVIASGVSVNQAAGQSLETDGGAVTMTAGSLDRSQFPLIFARSTGAVGVPTTSADPSIRIAGTIDTARRTDDSGTGGAITLLANGLVVSTTQSGNDAIAIDTGELELAGTGSLQSGGGGISLSAGTRNSLFAGSVVLNGTVDSSGGNGVASAVGGNVTIDAHRVDALGPNGAFNVDFVDNARGEGGSITANGANVSTLGGTLAIGSSSTQSISLDGNFDTTGGSANEDGLMTVVALDSSGLDAGSGRYGRGSVSIGENGSATLTSAGITISSRDVTTAANANLVAITATGATTAQIPESTLGIDSDPASVIDPSLANQGEVVLNGERQISLNAGTTITSDTIRIVAASAPSLLNASETNGIDQMLAAENPDLTRLIFGGSGGAAAANGVRLQGDDISISVGDGTTISPGLVFQETEAGMMPGTPNAFGLERGTRGDYTGLQLRDQTGVVRPAILSVRQDGNLTLASAAPTAPSQIFLGGRSGSGATTGAFATAEIGDDGQRIHLESSDGTLTIADAAGLSSDATPSGVGDNGLGWVELLGGLLLPPDATSTEPTTDSVVFSGGFAGDSAFNVEGLRVSTPRNLSITAQIAAAINSVVDLVFQAGRNTGVEGAERDGTLTVADGVSLQSTERLALEAGASGFGDLVFAGTTTTLAANDFELRAGAGPNTLNTVTTDRSEILGLANVEIRNAANTDFVSTGTTPLSFAFRQDAAIDAAVHLPIFDNFTSTSISSFDGAGAMTPVTYALRSDFGTIDLTTDAVDDARFTGAALSLVGLQSSLLAIQVNTAFRFSGPSIELGGVDNFTYTQLLAAAFNPVTVPADALQRITLRAGMNSAGTLDFESGVTLRAPRVDLVASNGLADDIASRIAIAGSFFDLSSPVPGDRTFVFQEDEDLQLADLPTAAQFTGGLPSILALRSDNGLIDITGFDIASLPIDLAVQTRLILEADTIELSETDGSDLVLSTDAGGLLENVGLRIRANTLRLEAHGPDSTTATGRVLAGARTGDSNLDEQMLPARADSTFSGESLLIEAFDATSDIATTTNLSMLARVATAPETFNLAVGQSPTTLIIDQDGAITPDELPNRYAIAGYLTRTRDDAADGSDVASLYNLDSRLTSIEVSPDNVSGSSLVIGTSGIPIAVDITFDAGDPGDVYDFANVIAFTSDSITIADGVSMNSAQSITLGAALLSSQPTTAYDLTNMMGRLVFEGAGPTTLSANRIVLSAGPGTTVTNPDGTDGAADGVRDTVVQDALARVDLSGLASVTRTGEQTTSVLTIQQSRDFDTASAEGDIVTPLADGAGAGEWDTIDLSSVQGTLTVVQPQVIAMSTNNLTLGRVRADSKVVVDTTTPEPFANEVGNAGFEGQVRIESNDITFSTPAAIDLQLDSTRLRLVSNSVGSGLESPAQLGLLRGDPNALERPIVRVIQGGDFSTTRLPRSDRYSEILTNPFTGAQTVIERDSLAQLDIELTTDGPSIIVGDSIREGASFSNLIVNATDPAAVITLQFSGLTPGFTFNDFTAPDLDATDFAALQLASLDITAGGGLGTIVIAPFSATMPAMNPTPDDLTIATSGDQRFSGQLALRETLSTSGRDMRFTGDLYREPGAAAEADAGLIVQTTGEIFFEEDIGTSSDIDISGVRGPIVSAEQLGKLWVLFDSDFARTKPTVQFGRRADLDGDGVAETAIASDQLVLTSGTTVFATTALNEPNNTMNPDDGDIVEDLRAAIDAATNLQDIANALDKFGLGRTDPVPFATIGKGSGDLSFLSSLAGGHFVMGSGERLSVGGQLTIDHAGSVVTLGDVAALGLVVNANAIGLVRRNASATFDTSGSGFQDGGSAILANSLDFGGVTPSVIGSGKQPRFGVINPYASTNPAFLGGFPVFAISPNGGPIDLNAFTFLGTALAAHVPAPLPRGASRSELSGAYGETVVPTPSRRYREPRSLTHPQRLAELAVHAHDTPTEVMLARLAGAAIIDDLRYAEVESTEAGTASITESRLDPQDAESAIALYEELFGANGEHADHLRSVLQEALDGYLETTRARRVIGFELRRFVKNRPSTLFEAYKTLDRLDLLFRYHRRLGLSPGEFRRIQRGWLEMIQPDGITLDELEEAIHPSRYVRGSDILDIFGR